MSGMCAVAVPTFGTGCRYLHFHFQVCGTPKLYTIYMSHYK